MSKTIYINLLGLCNFRFGTLRLIIMMAVIIVIMIINNNE